MAEASLMAPVRGDLPAHVSLEALALGGVSVDDIERFEAAPPAVPRQSPVIAPAQGPAGVEATLRYNLERLAVTGYADFNGSRFDEQIRSVGWDVAVVYGLTTAFGLAAWEWGNAPFRFESEGWFGQDTKYGGMDKVGHAYSGYMLTEFFTQRIAHESGDPRGAAITGALLGMGVQTYVELFDGFSGGHGFSYEDLVMDGVGVGFAILRNTVPGLAEKLDFRMEYLPSGHADGFAPVSDYSGQKYLLALKLSGFEEFEETPLRFLELQVGYFARGFSDEERNAGEDRRREPYVAVGLNLNELLDVDPVRNSTPGMLVRRTLDYVQVPYTYVPTSSD